MIEEFHNIFGPELKAVTGDPKSIEDVLEKVEGLKLPLQLVSIYYINSMGITCP